MAGKSIRVGPVDYWQTDDDNICAEDGHVGQTNHHRMLILIDSHLSGPFREQVEQHEYLEAMNKIYDIGLEHHQINLLEVALCDFRRNNPGVFQMEYERTQND